MQKLTQWAGTILGMIGAYILAQNNGLNDIAYCIMLTGSGFCLFDAIKQKQLPFIIMWGYFGICNIMGLVNYLK